MDKLKEERDEKKVEYEELDDGLKGKIIVFQIRLQN